MQDWIKGLVPGAVGGATAGRKKSKKSKVGHIHPPKIIKINETFVHIVFNNKQTSKQV